MIELDPKGNLTDLKWLPNGNLLLFGDFGQEVSTGSSYRWELRQWDARSWSENEGFRYHIGNGAFVNSHCRLNVDPTGSRLLIRGLADTWFALSGTDIPNRIFFPSEFGWQICPTAAKFLAIRHMRPSGPSCFIEVSYHSDLMNTRLRLIQFYVENYQAFFYGPSGKTIFVKRRGVPYLDEFEMRLPSPLVPAQQDPKYDAQLIRVRRFDAPPRQVVRLWNASDWGSVVIEFSDIALGDFQNSTLGFFHFDGSKEVVMLRGLGEHSQIDSIAIHPSHRFLAITQEQSSTVIVFDIGAQIVLRTFDWGNAPITRIDFSHDGTMIAAISGATKIIVWDVDF